MTTRVEMGVELNSLKVQHNVAMIRAALVQVKALREENDRLIAENFALLGIEPHDA